ncbi:MAG: Ku protein [Planctomycetaceae bacterium]|nr:Ku protein [Planctomycetaceae bacterium]
MAIRTMWRGVITVGKIRVGVRMYAASESRGISFHLLHDQDNVRLGQQMVCQLEDKPVEGDDIIKGIEVDENRYVLVEPKELEELQPQSGRGINVDSFVPADEVDGRYFERPYYLGPDEEPDKYAALVQAIEESGKVGICKWAFRNRSYVGALRSRGGMLELVTLRTGDEVVAVKDLELPHAKLSQKELQTAEYLVDQLTSDFDVSKYRDDFQAALEDLIKTKAGGGQVKKQKAAKTKATQPRELLDVLQASVAQIKGGRSKETKGGGKKKRARAA